MWLVCAEFEWEEDALAEAVEESALPVVVDEPDAEEEELETPATAQMRLEMSEASVWSG